MAEPTVPARGSAEGGTRLYDCLTCGACCCGEDGWVPVDGRDEAYVEASAELARNLVYVRVGSLVRRSLRMLKVRPEVGASADPWISRCFALQVEGGRVACRIYEGRPSACRELIAGSPECLECRRSCGVG